MNNHFSFYNLLRYSRLSDFIVENATGRLKKSVSFYRSFLGKSPGTGKLAFDIGANKGNKIAALLEMGFRIIALEPEKNSLSTLKWRFAKDNRVTIVEKGVSDKKGSTNIYISEPRSGLNTMSKKWVDVLNNPGVNRWNKKVSYKDSYEVDLTTLDDLIQQYGLPYFIKIDVEGYEENVLRGLKHTPAFISFETNLPEFLQETIGCIEHISALSANAAYNYSLDDKLESDKWLTQAEMLEKIGDKSMRYMEIVCKL